MKFKFKEFLALPNKFKNRNQIKILAIRYLPQKRAASLIKMLNKFKLIRRNELYWQAVGKANFILLKCRNNKPKAISFTKEAFYKYGGVNADMLPNSWVLQFLVVANTQTGDYFCEQEKKLIQLTHELENDLISVKDWLELYGASIRLGLFNVGHILRCKARFLAMEQLKNKKDFFSLLFGMRASIDAGNWNLAQYALKELKTKLGKKNYTDVEWLINILQKHNFSHNKNFYDKKQKTKKDEFEKIIFAKRIAVVGPAAAIEKNGFEIDNYDCVVKFNYLGGEKGRDANIQGRRIDVSYYNGQRSEYLIINRDAKIPSGPKFAVFKSLDHCQYLANDRHTQKRVINKLEWILFNGSFNAAPNAVYDLLRYQPLRIKLFNITLETSTGRYNGYAPASQPMTTRCRTFSYHDPNTQFNLLKHAWNAGLICGDKNFYSVISLTARQYMAKLQTLHGNEGRTIQKMSIS